jgi:hypothetical protein
VFDHPIILIIVAAAALLRWLSQKSDAGKPDPERPTVPDQPIPRGGETQTEEERIRRFLEALGQPATSTPPPKVRPRSTAPKREVLPHVPPFKSPPPPLITVLPPLVTAPPPLPTFPTAATQVPPPPPSEQRVFKPATAQEGGFEVRDLGAQVLSDLSPVDRGAAAELRGFTLKLSSIQNLRSAIVLREIFGPPRSLQPLDPISGF